MSDTCILVVFFGWWVCFVRMRVDCGRFRCKARLVTAFVPVDWINYVLNGGFSVYIHVHGMCAFNRCSNFCPRFLPPLRPLAPFSISRTIYQFDPFNCQWIAILKVFQLNGTARRNEGRRTQTKIRNRKRRERSDKNRKRWNKYEACDVNAQ